MKIIPRPQTAALIIALSADSLTAATPTQAQNVQAAGTVLLALFQSSPKAMRKIFAKPVENEFFPLMPGTTFVYEGTKEGTPTRTVTTVTNRTIRILNIDCIVVHDRNYEDGVLVEDTFDYYAQDRSGNVWYVGEDTKELDANGRVTSTEGTWRAGVNGAAPGLIMNAHPTPGDLYYQELLVNVAEDMANVRSVTSSTCVPYGCFDHVLKTRETSRLEPDVVDAKYYARGVGLIREDSNEGEHMALVRILQDH